MQSKKNEKADLSKNSGLYFIIGLTSILFISWQAIEWKTYDRSGYGYEALNVEDDDDEEIPITEQIKVPPPPPPPPPAPEVIEVVEDEEEVEETVIESTETDQEEIVEVEEVEIEEEFEDVDVPFAVQPLKAGAGRDRDSWCGRRDQWPLPAAGAWFQSRNPPTRRN